MKVIHALAQVFAIFAFLTLGSLCLIMALHILSIEDAIFKVRDLYASPVKSFQLALVGLIFILMGIVFSKMLVKQGRETDAIIFQSDIGPVVVSVSAVEDVVKKVLKRFPVIKESKLKTSLRPKEVQINLRLALWAGGEVPKLLAELQEEVGRRMKRLLGSENRVIVVCDVYHIEEREAAPQES